MKKKLAHILTLCFAFMMVLTACGEDPTKVDYNGVSYDQLYENSIQSIQAADSFTPDQIEEAVASKQYPQFIIDMLYSYQEAKSLCGEVKELGEFSVDKTGNTLTTKQYVVCQKRDLEFYVVFNYYDMSVTGYTVEPVYTLGEKMSKAALNTLISMLIVFAILILISLIISCFKIFPYIEEKRKKKALAEAEPETKDQVVTQIEQREQQLMDDTELVAVIAAAIAASTGTSTSDFVVRSINRR